MTWGCSPSFDCTAANVKSLCHLIRQEPLSLDSGLFLLSLTHPERTGQSRTHAVTHHSSAWGRGWAGSGDIRELRKLGWGWQGFCMDGTLGFTQFSSSSHLPSQSLSRCEPLCGWTQMEHEFGKISLRRRQSGQAPKDFLNPWACLWISVGLISKVMSSVKPSLSTSSVTGRIMPTRPPRYPHHKPQKL